jgi:hypothetical protein
MHRAGREAYEAQGWRREVRERVWREYMERVGSTWGGQGVHKDSGECIGNQQDCVLGPEC